MIRGPRPAPADDRVTHLDQVRGPGLRRADEIRREEHFRQRASMRLSKLSRVCPTYAYEAFGGRASRSANTASHGANIIAVRREDANHWYDLAIRLT